MFKTEREFMIFHTEDRRERSSVASLHNEILSVLERAIRNGRPYPYRQPYQSQQFAFQKRRAASAVKKS
jgi:hypothetical protein